MPKISSRRSALRHATLLAFGMALGKLDALSAGNGLLTVDLNQWRTIRFSLGEKDINVPVSDVFKALAEERG